MVNSLKMNNEELDWAQSCITSISFPETIDGLLDMLEGNNYKSEHATDIDCLLQFRVEDGTSWSAPKWLTQSDVLFFYHTKKAKLRITRLLKEAKRDYAHDPNLALVLEHATDLAHLYSGTIFGCAEVSGATEYFGRQEKHFDGRYFAPLGQVHIFEHPLASAEFADFIKIGQATITPIYSREAKGIRELLAERNTLPRFLEAVEFGDNTFRNVDKNNWAKISCLPSTRFIHEAQIREYLLDFFLNAMKDKGTPLLEECQCFRNGQRTGIADYFIMIGGRWVPFEAKLNVLSERDVFSQVAKYMNIDSFVPTKGSSRGKMFEANQSPVCLIADQSGVYIISSKGGFADCSYGNPVWKREQLGEVGSVGFREFIERCV